MNIAAWIIFGMVAGLIARILDPQSKDGVLGSMFLGIVGALIGAVLANIMFGMNISSVSMHTFTLATAASLILVYIGRLAKQA